MKVYFGSSGSEYYVMCVDFNEVFVFDMFGTCVGRVGCIDSCRSWVEVDFVSIVGVGVRSCEVLCNGCVTEVSRSLFDVLRVYRSRGGYLGTIFSVSHEDEFGRFSQVVLVFPKGYITKEIINMDYPGNVWKSISDC